MDLVYRLLVVLHIVGVALLLGGWIVEQRRQLRSEAGGQNTTAAVMFDGAATQVLTGLLLVGLAQSQDDLGESVNDTKIGIKLLVALLVLTLTVVHRRRAPTGLPHAAFLAMGALIVANVLIAVLWSGDDATGQALSGFLTGP